MTDIVFMSISLLVQICSDENMFRVRNNTIFSVSILLAQQENVMHLIDSL